MSELELLAICMVYIKRKKPKWKKKKIWKKKGLGPHQLNKADFDYNTDLACAGGDFLKQSAVI